jgi:hypothetical protein
METQSVRTNTLHQINLEWIPNFFVCKRILHYATNTNCERTYRLPSILCIFRSQFYSCIISRNINFIRQLRCFQEVHGAVQSHVTNQIGHMCTTCEHSLPSISKTSINAFEMETKYQLQGILPFSWRFDIGFLLAFWGNDMRVGILVGFLWKWWGVVGELVEIRSWEIDLIGSLFGWWLDCFFVGFLSRMAI